MTLFAGVVVGLIIAGLIGGMLVRIGIRRRTAKHASSVAFVVGFLFFMAEAL